MVSGPDVPTVEVRIYHDGVREAAEVVAVVVEAALREGWGDRYEIDVSTRDDRVAVDDEEAWWSWVDNHDTAKDCNLLVGRSGGWAAHADLAGDTSSCHRGAEIAELHGSPLFVAGDGEGHKELSTGIHEVGHNLGLVHRMGGTVDGGVTPMGHYNSEGETYHHYFHPRTTRSDLEVT
jgi:hypothetical protein